MNWQQLKYFAAVAQEEHFTRAAAKLFITQSTLSKAMDNLEKEIGVPLFEKQGRNIKLTLFGQMLKESALAATKLIDDSISQINEAANSNRGTIRVCSIFTMGSNFLPAVFHEYIAKYRKLQLEYTQNATSAIIEDVLNENVDVGFCGDFLYNEQLISIERKLVQTEELVLIAPQNHPLSKEEDIRIADVLDETFVGWNSNTGIILSIENALKEAGLKTDLKYSFSATEDNTVAGLVREGLGIALVANVPSVNFDGLVKLRITDLDLRRNLYMIWKKGRAFSASIRSFVSFVSERECRNITENT